MNNKELCTIYLAELEAESTASRKCLERVPESLYSFKPHPKSMEMGYLSLLVAEIPLWITKTIRESVIDFASYERFPLTTTQALLDHYEDCLASAIDALTHATEADFQQDFELRSNGQLLMKASKMENIGSTLNHWVHHRGQLSVYMRLNEIPVPSIYGPSADDRTF